MTAIPSTPFLASSSYSVVVEPCRSTERRYDWIVDHHGRTWKGDDSGSLVEISAEQFYSMVDADVRSTERRIDRDLQFVAEMNNAKALAKTAREAQP